MGKNKQSLEDILKNNQKLNENENRFVRALIAKSGEKDYFDGSSACYVLDNEYLDDNSVRYITISCYPIDNGEQCIDGDNNYSNRCIDAQPCIKLTCVVDDHPTIVDGKISSDVFGKGYRRTTLQILKECAQYYTNSDTIFAYETRRSDARDDNAKLSKLEAFNHYMESKKEEKAYGDFLADTGFKKINHSLVSMACNRHNYSIEGCPIGERYVMEDMLEKPLDFQEYYTQIGNSKLICTEETRNFPAHLNNIKNIDNDNYITM